MGFVLLTDAVGGVEVCLKEATKDEFSGVDFPAGKQTLTGATGLAFDDGVMEQCLRSIRDMAKVADCTYTELWS